MKTLTILLYLLNLVSSCSSQRDPKSSPKVDLPTLDLSGAYECEIIPDYFFMVTRDEGTSTILWEGYSLGKFQFKGKPLAGKLNKSFKGEAVLTVRDRNIETEYELKSIGDTISFLNKDMFLNAVKFWPIYSDLTHEEANQYLQQAAHLNFFTHPDSTKVSRIDFDESTERLGDFIVHYHGDRPNTRYQVGKNGQIKKLD